MPHTPEARPLSTGRSTCVSLFATQPSQPDSTCRATPAPEQEGPLPFELSVSTWKLIIGQRPTFSDLKRCDRETAMFVDAIRSNIHSLDEDSFEYGYDSLTFAWPRSDGAAPRRAPPLVSLAPSPQSTDLQATRHAPMAPTTRPLSASLSAARLPSQRPSTPRRWQARWRSCGRAAPTRR